MATITPGSRSICPHCSTAVQFVEADLCTDIPPRGRLGYSLNRLELRSSNEKIAFSSAECPHCGRLVMELDISVEEKGELRFLTRFMAWPFLVQRSIPQEVPTHIADDYREAMTVLNISPKASATLSRRCLQAVLREAGQTKSSDLNKQIDEVLLELPSYIAKDVDAIRHIGNFAAHSTKSSSTNQIVDVEPGEAEWNLEVLSLLFDFYYVQPALALKRRSALDSKLKDANKPPLKQP